MKVLFLVPYPTDGATNRIRVEQFFPYLKKVGISYSLRPFMSKDLYKIIYQKGSICKKIFLFIICFLRRCFDILDVVNFDEVFVLREVFPIGPFFLERLIFKLKPVVFDFDDAIYLSNVSKSNSFIQRFKNHKKIALFLTLSKNVIAGNPILAEFASKYNKNVSIIPSSIDANKYFPRNFESTNNNEVIIGWIGSVTTSDFLVPYMNLFERISKKYSNVKFKFVGTNPDFSCSEKIFIKRWSLLEEMEDLRSFDIGIMPLPDDEWSRGKCGFKLILYMSMGIPVVCSPVGANTKIVKEGVNGLFASTEKDWYIALTKLIENEELRAKFGQEGRKIVLNNFSVEVNASKFINTLRAANNENI